MDTGKFLILGNNNDYLRELLNIEGLNGYFYGHEQSDINLTTYDLILTNNTHLTERSVARLKEYIVNGGVMISIMPCQLLEQELNIERTGYLENTTIDDHNKEVKIQLFGLATYYLKSRNIHVLKTENIAGYPAIFSMSINKGKTFIIAFDFEKTIFSLTHGRDLEQDEKDANGMPRVDYGRLVGLKNRYFPQVDYLRRLLVTIIMENVNYPLPQLWYFPNSQQGGVAITHDSDGATTHDIDKVNQLDNSMNINATTFMMIFDGSPKSWRNCLQNKIDIQLHPILIPRLPKKLGIRILLLPIFINFSVIRKYTFLIQKFILDFFSAQKNLGVRNHGLVWPSREKNFSLLQSQRIEYDSTLGSNQYFGYMFGTGLPYFLRYPNTLRSSGILEFPMHIMDSVYIKGFGEEWKKGDPLPRIKGFLETAIKKHHALITFNFHHFFLLTKDTRMNKLHLYREIIKYIQHKQFTIFNLTSFNQFWRNRASTIVSNIKWDKMQGKLTFILISQQDINGLTYTIPKVFERFILVNATGTLGGVIKGKTDDRVMYHTDIKNNIPKTITVTYSHI